MIVRVSGAKAMKRFSFKVQLLYNSQHVAAPFIRLYSDRKYRSIDDFNKEKKGFKFGYGVDDLEETGPSTEKERATPQFDMNGPEIDLLSHPRLQGLRHNSPEFKYQLHLIQQEQQANQEKERGKWERKERLKGLGAGALALVSIISVYLLATNYKYIKTLIYNKWTFDIDDSKIQDNNNSKGNLKSIDYLVDKLTTELSPQFISSLKDSVRNKGLYLFGSINKHKLPSRVAAFDGKLIKDVLVEKDYVIVIDDDGKVYHYSPKFEQPVQVLMPGKVSKVLSSNNQFYYLSQDGKQIFHGDRIDPQTAPSSSWFSSGSKYDTKKLAISGFNKGESVRDISAGKNHLLILSSEGRVFEASTSKVPLNRGQFGVPKYSPFSGENEIPYNSAFELLNLNNEVVASKDGKYVKPRKFFSIASGEYFNIASDMSGNIWTWGDNTFGQCGKEVSANNEIQQLPVLAYTLQDLSKLVKHSLEDKAVNGEFVTPRVYAGSTTSYIRLLYESDDSTKSQEMILSFGSGIKGQLGLSRYMQVNSSPKLIKSLVGLTEFDENAQKIINVGIKDISVGNDHVFVTLSNASAKDVIVFGDNEHGQFGNGKTVKSSKPIDLPKLVEPADLEGPEVKARRRLARKLNDQSTNRLQLSKNRIDGKDTEQVIVAGEGGSAIFYRKG